MSFELIGSKTDEGDSIVATVMVSDGVVVVIVNACRVPITLKSVKTRQVSRMPLHLPLSLRRDVGDTGGVGIIVLMIMMIKGKGKGSRTGQEARFQFRFVCKNQHHGIGFVARVTQTEQKIEISKT